MRRNPTIFRRLVLVVALAGAAAAQTPPEAAAAASQPVEGAAPSSEAASRPAEEVLTASELSAESLALRIQQIENTPNLPDKLRQDIVALYRQAGEQITIAEGWQAKLDDYERRIRETPADLEAARAQPAPATQPADASASVEALTSRLAEAEAALRAEQEQQRLLDAEAENRDQRRRALPELMTATLQRRDEAAREAAAQPPVGADPLLTQAQRALGQARQRAIEVEALTYQRELAFYAARGDLLSLRREQARMRVRASQEQLNAVTAALATAREREIARQRAEVEAELQRAPQAVREVARRNAELARLRGELAPRISAAREQIRAADEHKTRVQALLDKLQSTAAVTSQSAYLGQRLRQAAASLDELRQLPVQVQRTEREIDDSIAGQVRIERDREELEPIEVLVARVVAEVGGRPAEAAVERVRGVFQSQRDLVNSVYQDYDELAGALNALQIKQHELAHLVDDVSDFIAEKILWVRSSEPLHLARWPDELKGLPVQMQRLAAVCLAAALANPTIDLAFALLILVLVAVRRRLKHRLHDLAQRVGSAYTDRFRFTLEASAVTALLALPIPLVLWYLAWRLPVLSTGDQTDVLGAALSAGFARVALVFLIYSMIQQICRPSGVGEAHLRWLRADLRLVWREVSWLKWTTAPIVAAVATCESMPDADWRDMVGRLLFMAGLLALVVFTLRLLSPKTGLGTSRPGKARVSLIERSRTLWWGVGLLLPPGLLILSAIGFHETALVLLRFTVRTIWLLLALMFVQALLVRWLFVAQRRIALDQARRRAAEAAAAAAQAGQPGEEGRPAIDEEKLNLVSLGDQTRQVLRAATAVGFLVGVLLIWADMLPALRVLDAVVVGSYTAEVPQTGPDGVQQVVATMQHITLTHVALATLIAFLTFVLAKNVPGLIEIILLRKLPIDAGGRYAVTSIARYVITGAGVALAFSSVGVAWSQVQWLVAAISVGLGFGLQEIFANFVSGLMLLFERQVRIGDTVTIGNVTGVVTRMRIRATTVTDWDRKELIIPNREFVTGQVINWTLSDTAVRLVLPVGLAYGSDTRQVEAELLQVAGQCRWVATDPPPRVVFAGFGDSAMQFELRAFTDVNTMVEARNELMRGIDDAFRKAGIEIAFPQREVRVRRVRD